jgi:NADH dehydrogenase [ubiquinone] 1 alpha subcomplex assembly factor 7
VNTLPDAPCIIVANEFFDALPVHQAVKTADGWHERMIGIADDGLAFVLDTAPISPDDGGARGRGLPAAASATDGALFEWRDEEVMGAVARRAAQWGAVLVIDYGHTESATGETLQALAGHCFADPLQAPGEADLTAHVDFQALGEVATRAGARVHGPVMQADFLHQLGIAERAKKLQANATPAQAAAIDAALARLTSTGPRGMGTLFKVMAIAHPSLPPLAGFAAAQTMG